MDSDTTTAMLAIQRNIMPETATIGEILARLDTGIGGVVVLTNARNQASGLVTDGDIRRAIMAGCGLEDSVGAIMNVDFVFGRNDQSRHALLALLDARIRVLPVLDEEGRLVELIQSGERWRRPLVAPSLAGNELRYVTDCIQSGWISSQGSYITAFEDAFRGFCDAPVSVATSSGSTALHLALTALGVGQGDEVIVPDLTFGASVSAVLHCGATPVFVDIDPIHWTISAEAAEQAISSKTRAIMPVHLYGHPCEMDSLLALADKHKLFVIEDCAEALGATYKGRAVGTMGHVGCFSFFANKIITTGEGGMVVARDPSIEQRIRTLRDHGMSKERRYWHLYPGFNYRMTNLQAAIGVAQMERIDAFLAARRDLVAGYDSELAGIPGVSAPPRESWADAVCWLYSIVIDPKKAGLDRDRLVRLLCDRGVECRPVFLPLRGQPAFAASRHSGTFEVSDRVSSDGLSLPTSTDMTTQDIHYIASLVREIVGSSQQSGPKSTIKRGRVFDG